MRRAADAHAEIQGEVGPSEKAAALLIAEYRELDAQRHAMYCLWTTQHAKLLTPPAWLPALLKGDWSAPHGMPNDWLPTVLHLRVNENALVEFTREIRADK